MSTLIAQSLAFDACENNPMRTCAQTVGKGLLVLRFLLVPSKDWLPWVKSWGGEDKCWVAAQAAQRPEMARMPCADSSHFFTSHSVGCKGQKLLAQELQMRSSIFRSTYGTMWNACGSFIAQMKDEEHQEQNAFASKIALWKSPRAHCQCCQDKVASAQHTPTFHSRTWSGLVENCLHWAKGCLIQRTL